jgi:O-antigen ligase
MKAKNNYLGIFLLFVIAVIPFTIEKQILGVWVTTTDILVLTALTAWMIKLLGHRDHAALLAKPLLFPVIGLLCTFVISSFAAVNPIAALTETCKYGMFFTLFYLFVNELDDVQLLNKIPAIIFVSSFVMSVWFVSDFFIHKLPFYYMKDWDRHPFSHVHFNLLGSYLVLTLPMGFYALQRSSRSGLKICLAVMLLAQVLALLFTYSRINWIVLILVILFMMTSRFRGKGVAYFLLLLAAASLILPHVRTDLKIKERMMSIMNARDGSYVERVQLSNAAIKLIERNPVTGIGINNFTTASKKYLNLDLNNMVHNIYLQFWAEAGIFAMILLAMLIVKYYFDVRAIAGTVDGNSPMKMLLVYSMVSFTALVLSNQFGDPFVRILKEYFALLLALPYAVKRAAQCEK